MAEESFIIPVHMVTNIEHEEGSNDVVVYVKNGFRITAKKDQFTDFESYLQTFKNNK